MVRHDRSRVTLRCMRCGGYFGVPPAPSILEHEANDARLSRAMTSADDSILTAL